MASFQVLANLRSQLHHTVPDTCANSAWKPILSSASQMSLLYWTCLSHHRFGSALRSYQLPCSSANYIFYWPNVRAVKKKEKKRGKKTVEKKRIMALLRCTYKTKVWLFYGNPWTHSVLLYWANCSSTIPFFVPFLPPPHLFSSPSSALASFN